MVHSPSTLVDIDYDGNGGVMRKPNDNNVDCVPGKQLDQQQQ